MSPGPMSPGEWGEEFLTDGQLEEAGYATGLDVWGPVDKAYENFVQDGTLANSQLWSLREAIRAETAAELIELREAAKLLAMFAETKRVLQDGVAVDQPNPHPCRLDVNGSCQEHDFMLEPGERCPQPRINELAAKWGV